MKLWYPNQVLKSRKNDLVINKTVLQFKSSTKLKICMKIRLLLLKIFWQVFLRDKIPVSKKNLLLEEKLNATFGIQMLLF